MIVIRHYKILAHIIRQKTAFPCNGMYLLTGL